MALALFKVFSLQIADQILKVCEIVKLKVFFVAKFDSYIPYLVLVPFMAPMVGLGIAAVVSTPLTPEQVEQQKKSAEYSESGRAEVENCLSKTTPWRCLQKMSISDSASNPPAGSDFSRVSYLVKKVPVKNVLQFCMSTNEGNCPEKLVGYGYSNEVVLEAMGSGT